MKQVDGETYMLASEAAKHLEISRVKFYNDCKDHLEQFSVGCFKRPYYKMSHLERLNKVQSLQKAS